MLRSLRCRTRQQWRQNEFSWRPCGHRADTFRRLGELLTMTSREIATTTGKEHAHVMRDIDILLTDLRGVTPMLPSVRDPGGGGCLQFWRHPQNGPSCEVVYKAAAEFSATAKVPGPNRSLRTVEIYNLPKDLTITLVSGYSIPMRHAPFFTLSSRPFGLLFLAGSKPGLCDNLPGGPAA